MMGDIFLTTATWLMGVVFVVLVIVLWKDRP